MIFDKLQSTNGNLLQYTFFCPKSNRKITKLANEPGKVVLSHAHQLFVGQMGDKGPVYEQPFGPDPLQHT